MTTESHHITVSGIDVEVVRKDIKNLHLGVYPPHGRVRVAAPLVVSDEAVRLAVIDKLAWIKRQQTQFAGQPRQSQREMVNGESHYFQGQRYRLRVHEQDGQPRVALRGIAFLDLFARPGSTAEQLEAVLLGWYRGQLKLLVPPLLEKWQPALGVQVASWGIKKMKTGAVQTGATFPARHRQGQSLWFHGNETFERRKKCHPSTWRIEPCRFKSVLSQPQNN